MTKFNPPDLSTGHIEARCVDREVAIYCDEHGLHVLADLCAKLIQEEAGTHHIHVEDYQVLTEGSNTLVIAKMERPS